MRVSAVCDVCLVMMLSDDLNLGPDVDHSQSSSWSRDISQCRKHFMTGAPGKASLLATCTLQLVTPGHWPPDSELLIPPDLRTCKGFNSLNIWPLAFDFEAAS